MGAKWVSVRRLNKKSIGTGMIGSYSKVTFARTAEWVVDFWDSYKQWDFDRHYKEMLQQIEAERLIDGKPTEHLIYE